MPNNQKNFKNTCSTFGMLDDAITGCSLSPLDASLKLLRHSIANLTTQALLHNSRT